MTVRICSVEGCGGKHNCRGWCSKHYQRWLARGTVEDRVMPTVDERFWAKVRPTGFCWEWTGFRNDDGYGGFFPTNDVPAVLAHRHAYELLVGPIPDGLVIDHLCRVRHCVNPDHLEPVTIAENIRRGFAREAVRAAWQAKYTHCRRRGHPMEGDNIMHSQGRRRCRECMRIEGETRADCPDCGLNVRRSNLAAHRRKPLCVRRQNERKAA